MLCKCSEAMVVAQEYSIQYTEQVVDANYNIGRRTDVC